MLNLGTICVTLDLLLSKIGLNGKGKFMYYVIYKSKTNYQHPYWWVIKSDGNHETLCSSEMLNSKQTCLSAIRIVTTEAAEALYYDRTGE